MQLLSKVFVAKFFLPAATALAIALCGLSASIARADVTAYFDVVPDTDPDLPLFGGTVSGPIQVGIDSVGRLAIDGPSFTDPLISGAGTIGVNLGGIGEVELAGLTSEWRIDQGDLIVGAAGQGYLKMEGGALVSTFDSSGMAPVTSGQIIIGEQFLSQGIVSVDGFGSIITTLDLIVGEEGFANLDVLNKANLRTETAIIGNLEDAIGRVTLTGLGTRWVFTDMSADDFVIGEEGRGTLEILDQAMVLNAEDVSIGRLAGSHGTVRVSGAGSLWQIDDNSGTDDLDIGTAGYGELFISDGGMVRVDGTTTVEPLSLVELSNGGILVSGAVSNSGIIRGAGRIESDLTINGTGELRNAALTANLREYTLVTGLVTSTGTIESLGGEMEFESTVTNDLEVVARDAIMRFHGGLVNNHTLTVGGDTTLHGDVTGTGDIQVLADSETLIVGDLTFSGSSALTATIGASPGTLDVLGSATLNGALLNLDYSAGVGAQPGDSYQVLSASGGISGSFSNLVAVADGLLWDIMYGSTTVTVTATGAAAGPIGPDFNGDGIVNGLDVIIWEMNFGTTSGATPDAGDADGDGDVDAFDYLKIQMQLGGPPSPLVGSSVTGAVPEPSAVALLLLGSVIVAGRRFRSAN